MAKGDLSRPGSRMWLPNIVLGAVGDRRCSSGARARAIGRFRIPLPLLASARLPPTRRRRRGRGAGAPAAASRVVVVVRMPHSGPAAARASWTATSRGCTCASSAWRSSACWASSTSRRSSISRRSCSGARRRSACCSHFFWFATPQFVYYVIPMSALMATLVTIGLLTKNSELVVMKACGISLYRAAVPLLCSSRRSRAPRCSGSRRACCRTPTGGGRLNHRSAAAAAADLRRAGPAMDRREERRASTTTCSSIRAGRAERAVDLRVRRREPGALVRRTSSTQAAFDRRRHARPGAPVTAGCASLLRRGVPRSEPGRAGRDVYEPFAVAGRSSSKRPDTSATEQPDAERMTYSALKRYIEELRASGFNVVPYMVELHRKIAFPFVTLVMTLLAVPFAVTTGRRGAMYGVGLGIVAGDGLLGLRPSVRGDRQRRADRADAGRVGAEPAVRRRRRRTCC